jgi:Na+-translocating ferredoxin:NAD+ oxidoreductase RnfG subunit
MTIAVFGLFELLMLAIVAAVVLKAVNTRRRHHPRRAPQPVVERDQFTPRQRKGIVLAGVIAFVVFAQALSGGALLVPWFMVLLFIAACFFFAKWFFGQTLSTANRSGGDRPGSPVVHEATANIPKPPAPPSPPRSPAANTYPEQDGVLTVFVRTFLVLALFAAGAASFLVSTDEVRESQIRERHLADTRLVMSKKTDALAPQAEADPQGVTHLVFNAEADTAPPADTTVDAAGESVTFANAIDKTIKFESRALSNEVAADLEALHKISRFLVQTLETETPVRVGDWSPAPEWIARNLVDYREVTPEQNELGQRYKVRMDVELTQERLEQVYEQYRSEKVEARTTGLVNGYAGAILLLGGASILLRLGTSRRASLPARA